MIVVMEPKATAEQVQQVIQMIREAIIEGRLETLTFDGSAGEIAMEEPA